MNHALLNLTDKVARMVRSMVLFTLQSREERGATTAEIAVFLSQWSTAGRDLYHEGVVDRALTDLARQGLVVRAGLCWYPATQAL